MCVGKHSPRLAFGEWQWCRACGALRNPRGDWEAPTGRSLATDEVTEPAIRTIVHQLTALADRDAQNDRVRAFAKMSAGGSPSDAVMIDRITHDFASLLRERSVTRTPATAAEEVPTSAVRILFMSQHVDADEAAVALAALLKAAGVTVRLWAGRRGESITIVVDAYDSQRKQWIPVDPMGGVE